MKMRTIIPAIAFVAVAGAAGILAGCQKEELGDNMSSVVADGSRMVNPKFVAQTLNSPVTDKAYLAAHNTGGTCTGGPMFTYNGVITYFTPTNAASPTTVNDVCCYTVAVASHPVTCSLYVAVGTLSVGFSELHYVTGTGALAKIGDIDVSGGSGNPFYVEEMEFGWDATNSEWDLFLVPTGSGTRTLYRLDEGQLDDATMQTNLVGNMFGISATQRKLTLVRDGQTLKLVWEESGGTQTKVADITLSSGALGTVTGYNVPDTYDYEIASYFYSGDIYVAKNSTLYKIDLPGGTVSNVGSPTMSTRNEATFYGFCN